ncbi:hypothetical protein [Dyadobacter sp. CY356]|uniref:hypothetical protein n=1 Tax=Dyadobacter sp. CY356 TaxID=2906442 RepID=UPI001F199511|nr:hypothetical protein [Dyadobacter sp. CY356]MCF0057492.1 hypothetical protein [Dyadobacter sp. CY356]
MKNFSIILISITSLWWSSCKKENNPEPTETYLNKITELRYLPDDSITVQSELDSDGVIRLERSSKSSPVMGFRENPENLLNTKTLTYYRLYTFSTSNKLIKFTQFGHPAGAVSMSDSSIFSNTILIKKELKSYRFYADGDYYFRSPLWLTKRSFTYDSQNRISIEADSVFICHDVPKGEFAIVQRTPKFIFTTTTNNIYNSKNELATTKTATTRNNDLFYSNGWNAFLASQPGKLYIGTTNYSYEYDSNNRIITKVASFVQASTNQVYNSIFSYSYAN